MLSVNRRTYFFTREERIVVENTKEFIIPMLQSLIETYTTGKPCMFKIGTSDSVFYFLWGYDVTFLITLERTGAKVQFFNKDIYEFTEEALLQMDTILNSFSNDLNTQKKIKVLYDELAIAMSNNVEIFSCYDVRRKTIDELLYAYENKKDYAIIYDRLDEITESYRVITENLTFLLTLNHLGVSIQIIDVCMDKFTELLYEELKDSKNEFIKKYIVKLKKYIKKEHQL